MRSFITFFLCSLVAFCFAQKKVPLANLDLQPDGNYYLVNTPDPFTGTAVEDYPNGRKKHYAEFKDGKLHGEVTKWHEKTREKESVVRYENGKRVGVETHWYPSGVKKLEVPYQNGEANGTCKEWYENEKLKSEGQFVKGKETGLHRWYFLNGKLDQTIEYENGKANGKTAQYYPEGGIRTKGNYKEGKPHGSITNYYRNGKKKNQINYKNGLEDGLFSVWSKRGILQEERKYDLGEEVYFKNFRSGAIKTKEGFLQVFNEKESFFMIHVNAGWVRPRQSRDITYVVDKYVLQLFNTPVSDFHKEGELSDEELLRKHLGHEKDFIEKGTKSSIEPNAEFKTNGRVKYLHWSFENPLADEEKNPYKRVVKEHYYTMVCDKQILTLYVPQTAKNDESEITQDIAKMVSSLDIKAERIDLNEVRREIRTNAGLPPLPANETIDKMKIEK